MTDLSAALRHNPFEGDFGSPGDRVLRDKIVTARRPGICITCALSRSRLGCRRAAALTSLTVRSAAIDGASPARARWRPAPSPNETESSMDQSA